MTRTPSAEPLHSERHATIRRAARAHFDRWALSYDRSWLNELVFFPAVRACYEEIARWQSTRASGPYRLLDVGCGTGTLITLLSEQPNAAQLIGLDYSAEMVRHLADKVGAVPHAAKLHAVQGDAERLPFNDETFDVLTCCNSFHHYPHQPAVIREFRRVLRPGGLLLLVDGFRDNVVGWVVFDVAVSHVETNVHHASWSETRDMITAAGFATLRQRKMGVLAPLLVNVAVR
ncbi:MAG: class I SAM-dependent methyltransferase [Phycisphaerae bacterium]|nr:class I SAM-dependent methyltransferase [Phycisphaerae bacterium]